MATIGHRSNWWRFVFAVMIHVIEAGGGVAAVPVVVSCIMVLRHMYVFGAYELCKYQFHV